MEGATLSLFAAGVLVFALISGRAERSILTPPMMFALFGLLVSPVFLGLVDFGLNRAAVNALAEVTLVVVLFTDASRIDVRRLVKQHDLPVRLLGIGLPLTIAAGTGLALLLMPHLGFWVAALLGTILAPTDAALGQAVVNNPQVPVRIRQALNVESGLNDGMSFPALLFFMAGLGTQAQSTTHWVLFLVMQLTLGPVAGVGVGYLGSKAVDFASSRKWMNEVFRQISVLALAVLAYGVAETIHGNGFIAAFSAGLTVGTQAKPLKEPLHRFGETEGQLLGLITFLIFGAVMVPMALRDVAGVHVAYALLSLSLVRMVPVAISLIGTGLRPVTFLFLGWFGPRGLASILYLLLLYERGRVGAAGALFAAVVTTVGLSVVLHGVTSAPGARRYAGYIQRAGKDAAPSEHKQVHPFPVRIPPAHGQGER